VEPESFEVRRRPALSIRWALARAGIMLGATMMRLSCKLLVREHPVRVFVEGRLDESLEPTKRALCRGPLISWAGETLVRSSALLALWTLVDFAFDLTIGPLELFPSLASMTP
jgi:hypothetical protein